MDRKEIVELARSAAEGNHRALADLKRVALAAGFAGGRGGWIRSVGYSGPVCQGWAALAVKARGAGWVLDRLVASEARREADHAVTVQAELDRSKPATFPAVESVAPDAHTVTSVAPDSGTAAFLPGGKPNLVGVKRPAGQAHLVNMRAAEVTRALLAGDQDAIQAMAEEEGVPVEPVKEYGLEILTPVSGVARVALTEELDGQVSRRVKVFHGDTALQDATSFMLQLQAGTATVEEPVEPRVHPGDVVTVHRGVRRYEVLRVELDAWKNGERCDYARIVPCAPEDEREAQWVAMDLLHRVEPVATLHVVTVNGFLVTDELVDLCHHSTGVAEADSRRIALIQDPAMGGAKTTAVLVDPRFPRGAMPGAEEVAERPAMFPGDCVLVERPGQTMPSVYRWMPELDPVEGNPLQDVTWVSRTREPVTS